MRYVRIGGIIHMQIGDMTFHPWASTKEQKKPICTENRDHSCSTNVFNVKNNRYYENQKKILILSGLNDILETGSAQK